MVLQLCTLVVSKFQLLKLVCVRHYDENVVLLAVWGKFLVEYLGNNVFSTI